MSDRLTLAAACLASIMALSVSASAQQSPKLSDEDYTQQVLAAAPEAVAKNAAVVRPEPDGSMRTIRKGTNGFTCLAMGTDRMCGDKNSMAFIHAIMSQQQPPDQLGFAYMLGGDTGPSGETGGACNTSPYKTPKDSDCHWIVTGPHVMLLGPPSKRLGYTDAADADPTRPYMMWANTPYEHAMIPVR
jgi:hypothetical protein